MSYCSVSAVASHCSRLSSVFIRTRNSSRCAGSRDTIRLVGASTALLVVGQRRSARHLYCVIMNVGEQAVFVT